MQMLRIGHNNAGARPEWHLEKVSPDACRHTIQRYACIFEPACCAGHSTSTAACVPLGLQFACQETKYAYSLTVHTMLTTAHKVTL